MIERASAVLFAFTVEQPELGLGEVARRTGLPASTVRRLLVQLTSVGLVEQDPETQRYSLSLRLAQLGSVALERVDVIRLARAAMQEVTDQVGEAAFLGQLTPHGVVYLAVTQPPVSVRVTTRVGDLRPAHTTAMGKVLLAALSPEELRLRLQEPLVASTNRSHVSLPDLLAELGEVRASGLATNFGEAHPEYSSVAAPVLDHRRQTVAALAISAPTYRVPEDALPRLSRAVVAAAAAVSQQLGCPLAHTA
ncbi:IclR family transcriptional regulator [Geodermatophilus ruber]|uniref:IclR family transcriptional regulator n=1 Tax=Geodermatophilus ruber TaxID=504800 RepID=UPI0015A4F9FD|nr:IclR family transcriptional regulator [Geodermatophilus ruber]